MELSMEIKLATINNTPVFTVQDISPRWSRVYGAMFQKRQERWLLPAFPPFLEYVLHDIEQVYSAATFDATAKTWIDEQKSRDEWDAEVRQLTLPVPSYEHQLSGLVDILHNYRWILKYEMGTGKTKIVIDQVNYLKIPTLILCPLIALDNWVAETEKHSGGSLSVLAVKGASKKSKIENIQNAVNYDIRVVTYDTARIYGVPQLFPKASKAFLKAMMLPHHELKKIIKSVNDETMQERFAIEWTKGRKPADIKEEAEEYRNGKPQWLCETGFKQAVCDESHRLKDMSSLRTKECLKLAKTAARRIHLTGTLSHGDPRDLYPQLKFLASYILPDDYKTYCKKHLVYSAYNEHMVVGFKDIHILNRKVNRISSERRLDDCVDLPARRFEIIKFDLSPAQRRDYNHAVQNWMVDRPDTDPLEIQNGAIRISKLLQICSGFVYVPEDEGLCDNCAMHQVRTCVNERIRPGTTRCIRKDVIGPVGRLSLKYPDNPKLKCLEDKLVDLIPGNKAIVWASLTEELDDIERMIQKNKWGYVRVDGKTSKHISKMADKFEKDPSCRLYIAQISTGISVTLNAAKYMMYYSRDWSVDHRYQSLFRNYRIGQDKKTVVYDFCAARTLELQQLRALESKEQVADLMTKKINCALCRNYAECTKGNIKPWEPKCVLSTKADRVIAQARTI